MRPVRKRFTASFVCRVAKCLLITLTKFRTDLIDNFLTNVFVVTIN